MRYRLERFPDLESSAVGVFLYILYKAMFPFLGYIIIAGGVIFFAWPWLKGFFIVRESPFSLTGGGLELKYRPEMEDAIKRIQNEPEKVKPAWDLARLKLELYFDRNLSQINSIFWLSVVVMLVGFVFILFGISLAFTPTLTQQSINTQGINGTSANAQPNAPALIGGIAGIITEFIGATFLFLYRSTIQQAASFTKTLERINSVGMAMQILDTISSESKELQDKTKADIIKLILSSGGASPASELKN